MKTILASIIGLVSLAWGWDVFVTGSTAGGTAPWAIRQEAMYLSGLLSIALMSFTVLLAARPAWLEAPLGGMDRMYRTHKWAGILAVGFAALHWLIEMSDDIIKALIGREGRLPKETYTGFLEVLRDLAKDMGEWAIYAVLAMLAITLWKRFPYRRWRFLHQAMPAIYLMLAFHAALLAPSAYWSRPVGVLLALFLAGGVYGSLHSLAGRIGRSRQVPGEILSIEKSAPDIIAVRCQLGEGWRGHRAGQFAFISFDRAEGQHPFTIASADRGDRTVTFQIKALGDYTRQLAERLHVGQPITVEGPYGRFDMAHHNRQAQQVWIAGGIGVTPFLAWLESLQVDPANAPAADLHYCTRDREADPFVARLEALCAPLSTIQLHIHGARQGEVLSAQTITATGKDRHTEVWFCGPQGLANAIKAGLQASNSGRFDFHQEAFEMR
jgi:predicted ferric reductase